MIDPHERAASYGVVVTTADLGAWGAGSLIAEYDPDGAVPTIRINVRAIERYRTYSGTERSVDVKPLVDFAIAHELYHHRERLGEIARLPTLRLRERAADAYARGLVGDDPAVAAFLGSEEAQG